MKEVQWLDFKPFLLRWAPIGAKCGGKEQQSQRIEWPADDDHNEEEGEDEEVKDEDEKVEDENEDDEWWCNFYLPELWQHLSAPKNNIWSESFKSKFGLDFESYIGFVREGL